MVGYGFWGYLSDRKVLPDGKEAKTPDGNAFYSWCIIDALINVFGKVVRIFPRRDATYELYSFEETGRKQAVQESYCLSYPEPEDYEGYSRYVESIQCFVDDVSTSYKLIILENRFMIEGRNDEYTFNGDVKNFQPDKVIFDAWVYACEKNKIPCIILDLDYKLEDYILNKIRENDNFGLMELGRKYENEPDILWRKVCLPFRATTKHFLEYKVEAYQCVENDLCYIGNRYERDECIDKYFDKDVFLTKGYYKINFYGNWLEPKYNDAVSKWPSICFNPRVCAIDFPKIYMSSLCTFILAKQEYFDNDFVTTRIIEAIYFGCIPIMPIEYSDAVREKYLGQFKNLLTVVDAEDLRLTINLLRMYKPNNYLRIAKYLFERIMDIADESRFIMSTMEMCNEINQRMENAEC